MKNGKKRLVAMKCLLDGNGRRHLTIAKHFLDPKF
jgi:hypothetical protein